MGYPAGVTITNEVDPVSRIEGHLGVGVVVSGGSITDAFAHGNLWRGFENFLLGRDVNDAITFVQRICGVCPVPHGMTSTYAVDSVLGYSENHITFAGPDANGYGVPAKAVSIRNLVLGAEFLMSSITHFYHLAAPSYVQGPAIPPWTPYFNTACYDSNLVSSGHGSSGVAPGTHADGFSKDIWSVVILSYVKALRIRRLTFEAGALFAGRMPMTSTYIGGGVTFDGTENLTDRATMFENIMVEIGQFVMREYVPIALALGLLYPGYDNLHNNGLAGKTTSGYGSGLGRYLAWGAFPDPDVITDAATLALPGGVKDINAGGMTSWKAGTKGTIRSNFITATSANAVPKNLTEDIANSRYQVDSRDSAAYNATTGGNTYCSATAAYPGKVSRTSPKRDNGYTYMKAPRWAGKSMEVGPLARMMVAEIIQDNVLYTSAAYYAAYGKSTGLNPAMISADIAVCLLRATLATIQNATVANALDPTHLVIPLDHDFTYAEITAHLSDLETLLGTTGAYDTIAAAYAHTDTFITGTIATWVLGLKGGASTMDRLRARAIESLYLIQKILGDYTPSTTGWTDEASRGSWAGGGWVAKLKAQTGTSGKDTSTSTWRSVALPTGGDQGWGATEAPRGALMHQVTIDSSCKITKYQCIVPTTWNGSPVIGASSDKLNHGAIEAACIGAPFANQAGSFFSAADGTTPVTSAGGVEVLRIAQSFDPCIACAIH